MPVMVSLSPIYLELTFGRPRLVDLTKKEQDQMRIGRRSWEAFINHNGDPVAVN